MMMMGWKCHSKVLALPTCSYSPRQVTSVNSPSFSFKYNYNYNNIITINNNRNEFQFSSMWLGRPLFSSSSNFHRYCHNGSTSQEEQLNYDLFAADKFFTMKPSVFNSTNVPDHSGNFVFNSTNLPDRSGNFIDLLSKILASLLSYGVVFIFITMAACMYNPYSALAASCGRMGGGSSSSYSSHGSSSSSGSSDSYDYDEYDNYSRRLTFICTCDSNCTQCNCNIKEKDNEEEADIKEKDNEEKAKAKDNTCTCNCHKSCYFHCIRKNYNPWIAYIYIIGTIIATVVSEWCEDDDTPPVQPTGTMLCFQVGVSDKERVLQRKLNHIAEVADTSTLNGLDYLLKEVVKALIEQNEFSFQFSSVSIEYDSMESLSKRFQQIISRERVKYGEDEETLVNVDGVKYKKNSMVEANSSNIENEYTLATVSVLATGKHLIPSTNKKRHVYLDCVAVLQTLKSIPKAEIQSVEVLWSPQKEDDVLLKEQGMFREEPGRDCPMLIGFGKEGRIYMQ